MPIDNPSVVILAGPNGAGKSTAAPKVLRDDLKVDAFVNADVIAQGLSGYSPNSEAMAAGRIMLKQLDALEQRRADFAFETTLASRSFAPRLKRMRESGYTVHLIYLWVPDSAFSINRVAGRVRHGGHHVPADWVRRRYTGGLRNFFTLYQPLADYWRFFDNTTPQAMEPIAQGETTLVEQVYKRVEWDEIRKAATK
jgi:predicted ABC-type ATPase